MPKPRITHLLACALCTLATQQNRALAQPATQSCVWLPNPIILYGTTAVEPVIANLGARLSQLNPPYSLLYVGFNGCDSLGYVSGEMSISGSAEFYSMKDDGTATIDTCSLNSLGKNLADVSLLDVYRETCPGSAASVLKVRDSSSNGPEPMVDFQGPIQASVFVVPRSNFSTTYLSLDQMRDILVCGSSGQIYPFVDKNQIFTCGGASGAGDSGMTQMTFASLGLSIQRLCGLTCNHDNLWISGVAASVAHSITPKSAIGFVSGEVYDQYRDSLKSLAMQGPGQSKAYYPDSNSTSRDRRMVRDGHYVFQGPLHMVARASPDNVLEHDGAKRFINWMLQKPGIPGEAPLPFNIIDVFAESGVVPQCAMQVRRYKDGGPFTPYRDAQPCGCYFEAKATGVAEPCGCKPCSAQSECGSQLCSYGFCE